MTTMAEEACSRLKIFEENLFYEEVEKKAVKNWTRTYGNAKGERWNEWQGHVPWGDRFWLFPDGSVLSSRHEWCGDVYYQTPPTHVAVESYSGVELERFDSIRPCIG